MDIRNLGPDNGGNVPVVAISGYMLDSEVVAGGFQSILRKPFTPDQLLAAIDGVLPENRNDHNRADYREEQAVTVRLF